MKEYIHPSICDVGVTFDVYPSGVNIQVGNERQITIDVGTLYAMFSAHASQNGFWSDIDFDGLPESTREKFRFNGSFVGHAQVTGLRFRRKS